MYHTILLPLDGSPLAERALPFAAALARASGARIVVVRASADDLDDTEQRVDPFTGRVFTVDLAERYLKEVQERLAAGVIRAEIALVRGDPPAAIVSAAESHQADAIVMATHGWSGLGRWVYGSVAEAVLRDAYAPVLLVPAAGSYAWPAPVRPLSGGAAPVSPGAGGAATSAAAPPAPGEPFRVLVTLDGSEVAREALGPAGHLARTFGAELLLLQVVPVTLVPYAEPYPYVPYDPAPAMEEAQRYLDGEAETLRGEGHTVEVLVKVGTPAASIADAARARGASVIAMATHGRTGLARVVLGSVATGVLHLARCPLLLLRPRALSLAA